MTRIVSPIVHQDRAKADSSRPTNRRFAWLIGIGLFGVLLAATIGVEGSTDRPTFTMPRAVASYELARAWVEAGVPSLPLQVPNNVPTDLDVAFGPRDSLITDRAVRPRDFPVNVALLAIIHLTGDWMLYALGALSGVAAILLVRAISIRLGAVPTDAALAALLFATSVAFLGNFTTLGAFDVTGVAMLLLGAYGMLRLDPIPDRWWPWAAISGTSFAVMIGLRYPSIIIVGFVYAAILLTAAFPPKVHATAFAAFALVIIAIALYHTWLYGGPLANGYSLDGADSGSAILSASRGRTQAALGWHFRTYLLTIETGVPIVIGVAGTFIALRWGRAVSKAIAAGLLLSLVAYTALVGAVPLWGSDFYVVNASFLRYFLPVLAVAAAFGSLAFARIPGMAKFVLVGSIVTMSISVALFNNGGLVPRAHLIKETSELREAVLLATTPNSIVMTRIEEKLLWPERQTMLISYAVENLDPERSRWLQIPDDDDLAAMASRLDAAGLDVFLLESRRWASKVYLSRFDAALASLGLQREISAEDETWVLHGITR